MSEIPAQLAAALADRYRIEEGIGAGGMATAYLAYDVRHERHGSRRIMTFHDDDRLMYRPEFAVSDERVHLTIGEFQSDMWVIKLGQTD